MSKITAEFLNPEKASEPKTYQSQLPRQSIADFLAAKTVDAFEALRSHAEHHARQQGRIIPFNSNPQIHRTHGGDRWREA